MEPDTSVSEVPRSSPTNLDSMPKKRGRPRKEAESVLQEGDPRGTPVESALPYSQGNEAESAPVKKKSRRSNTAAAKPVRSAPRNDLDVDDDEDDMVPYNPPIRGKGRTNKASTNAKKATKGKASLSAIVKKFEDQYEAMGQMYQQLGQTIQELKSCIQENRTATEQEIRDELLHEVQNTLLKSFGKS